MPRKVFIIIALICLTLSVIVWAQDKTNVPERIKASDDYNKVTALIYREIDSCLKGDSEKVYSCYDADSFVGYSARGSQDPNDWIVRDVGPEVIRKYADGYKTPLLEQHPDWSHFAEVKHVSIKGDHGLAVAKQWNTRPDKDARETFVGTFQSVFFVTKIKGKWKITGWISGGITWSREFYKHAPQ